MEINKFRLKIVNSLLKRYDNCKIEDDVIKIINGCVEVQIPIIPMYQEYLGVRDYKEFLSEYCANIDKLLQQSIYNVDYDKVFPIVKRNDYGGSGLEFHTSPLFEDIELYFGEDLGEMYRIVSKHDKVEFDKLYDRSMENLNKLMNPLAKLHENLEVYTLRYNSDVASSMFLNKSVERSIIRIFGLNFIFAIPAASSLLISKNTPDYIKILRELIKSEEDPNRIVESIIEFKNGIYRYVG